MKRPCFAAFRKSTVPVTDRCVIMVRALLLAELKVFCLLFFVFKL